MVCRAKGLKVNGGYIFFVILLSVSICVFKFKSIYSQMVSTEEMIEVAI